jgi:hypothetical protein
MIYAVRLWLSLVVVRSPEQVTGVHLCTADAISGAPFQFKAQDLITVPNPALSGEQGVGCAELWAVYAVQ